MARTRSHSAVVFEQFEGAVPALRDEDRVAFALARERRRGEASTAQIAISKMAITRGLVATVLMLHVLNVPALVFSYVWPHLKWTRLYVTFFRVTSEGKIPTFYSGLTLIAAAMLLALIGMHERANGGRFYRHWIGLAAIFVLMAMDEMLCIHEMTARPLRELLGVTSGPLVRAWVIPAMIFLGFLGLAYFRFLVALAWRSRVLFVSAGAIFVVGAVGLEMVGGAYVSAYGARDLDYGVIATLEELLEMAGMVLFLYALMDYAERYAPRNQIHIIP